MGLKEYTIQQCKRVLSIRYEVGAIQYSSWGHNENDSVRRALDLCLEIIISSSTTVGSILFLRFRFSMQGTWTGVLCWYQIGAGRLLTCLSNINGKSFA